WQGGRAARPRWGRGAFLYQGRKQSPRGGAPAGRDVAGEPPPAAEEPRAPPSARTRYPRALGAGPWPRSARVWLRALVTRPAHGPAIGNASKHTLPRSERGVWVVRR